MKKLFCLILGIMLLAQSSFAAVSGNVSVLSYSSTNVLTSAYVVLVSSTPISSGNIQICDTSGKVLKFAIGATGSEVDSFTVQVSGCVVVPKYIPAGSQINIRAVDATASSGYNVMSFL